MNKVIIPKEIFKIKYGKLTIDKKFSHTNEPGGGHLAIKQLNSFTSPNATYSIDLNPDKRLFDLKVCGGVFNFLNVEGDLEINIKNNPEYFIMHYTSSKNSRLSDYPNNDYLKSKKLTINSQGVVKFTSWNFSSSDAPSPLEELTINAQTAHVDIQSFPNLKKLVLNTSGKTMDVLRLDRCSNLELLDISKTTHFHNGELHLNDLPDKCKIKLNPQCLITSSCSNISDIDGLKRIFDFEDKPTLSGHNYIYEILGLDKTSTEPITISVYDFKEKLLKFSNQRIQDLWNKALDQEKKEMKFLKENINLSRKEQYLKKHPSKIK